MSFSAIVCFTYIRCIYGMSNINTGIEMDKVILYKMLKVTFMDDFKS